MSFVNPTSDEELEANIKEIRKLEAREPKSSNLDLISRLRAPCGESLTLLVAEGGQEKFDPLRLAAAREIERLTTALQVETICHQVASDSNRAKREEIELLKQQLFEARNDLDSLHDIMRGERAPAPEPRDG